MIGGFNCVGFDASNLKSITNEKSLKTEDGNEIANYLNNFIVNGEIDVRKLQDASFPIKKADVFISYSHNDNELARNLKNWLEKEFGLSAFVDYDIWHSADAILKKIDDEYCFNKGKNLYDYPQRNLSTSYVHIMLCSAIIRTIDSCNFMFVLNTHNSIDPESAIKEPKTHSPWIYFELSVLKYIRFKENEMTELLLESTEDCKDFANFPAIDLEKLPELRFSDLEKLKSHGKKGFVNYLKEKLVEKTK